MADQNEQKLRALELLQSAGERLTQFDKGTLQALRRAAPMLVARVDAALRIEESRASRKHTRKGTSARRAPSVFDADHDDDDRLLP